MNNFNISRNTSGERKDNPWAVDSPAEYDSEKSIAERLAEININKIDNTSLR